MSVDTELFSLKDLFPTKIFGITLIFTVAASGFIFKGDLTSSFFKDMLTILIQINAILFPAFLAALLFLITNKRFLVWLKMTNEESIQRRIANKLSQLSKITLGLYLINLFILLFVYMDVVRYAGIVKPYWLYQWGLIFLLALTFYCQIQSFVLITSIINIVLVDTGSRKVEELFRIK